MFKTNQPKETMTKNKYATIQDLVPEKILISLIILAIKFLKIKQLILMMLVKIFMIV